MTPINAVALRAAAGDSPGLYMWLTGLCPSPPRPGCAPESCMGESPTTPDTFSSSRRFRHAAFGFRLRSAGMNVRGIMKVSRDYDQVSTDNESLFVYSQINA